MTTTTRKTLTDPLVELGYIAGVFGVRGEVRLHLHNPESSLFDAPLEVTLSKDGVARVARITLRTGASGGKLVARIDGVEDRNAAEELKGSTLAVPESMLPELDEGEYYLSEVVGMDVYEGDVRVGEVIAVHSTGPVEVFELDGERYLPSTRDRLLGIDRERRRILIAEGALAV